MAEQQAEFDAAFAQLGDAIRHDLIDPVRRWADRHRTAIAILALLWVMAVVISEVVAG